MSDPSARRRVLVTGAMGDIARQVVPWLRERHDLTLLDVDITGRDGTVDGDVRVLDLTRDITGYISERDLGQLADRAIIAEDVSDDDGVPFLIAYGTSANARRFWDIGSARRVLGYEPADDSEVAFALRSERCSSTAATSSRPPRWMQQRTFDDAARRPRAGVGDRSQRQGRGGGCP